MKPAAAWVGEEMFVSCPLGRCCVALMLHPKTKINSSKSIQILFNAPSRKNMHIYIYILIQFPEPPVLSRGGWWCGCLGEGTHGYRYRRGGGMI